MKQRGYAKYWILAISLWGKSTIFAEPFAVGPYLGQMPPGPVAKVFASGLICDTRPYKWESWPVFSADGNTFCFNRQRYTYITVNTDQGWTRPESVDSIPYHAWSGCLSPDANSIYIRCGPFSRLKRRRSPRSKGWCMRRCTRTSQGWSLPLELGSPFDVASGDFSVAADNSICFNGNASIGGGFWLAPFVGDTWAQASKIPIEMGNLRGHGPGIAPDKSFLVFYSVKPGAPLGTETNLYLTLRRPDGSWTEPQNMGPRINSPYYEFAARISPDKKYMFFTRSTGWNLRPVCDTGDIYWVELKEYLPESYR
jgi:hypothetical protein